MRLPRIDMLRGCAVVLMVIFHIFAIRETVLSAVVPFPILLAVIGRSGAILFLTIFGVSTVLSDRKYPRLRDYLPRRLLLLGASAALVTLGSMVIDTRETVVFGILHLFFVAALLLAIVRPLGVWTIALGILVLLGGVFVDAYRVDFTYLLPLGLHSWGFTSFDYYPLIPYFGYVLLGYGMGRMLLDTSEKLVFCVPISVPRSPYCPRTFRFGTRWSRQNTSFLRGLWNVCFYRKMYFAEVTISTAAVHTFLRAPGGRIERLFALLGRHSLTIYLLHIPLIWALWEGYSHLFPLTQP